MLTMFKNKKYFTKGQYIFWALIILFLLLAFFHFLDGVFQREGIAKQIVSIEKGDDFDTLDIVKIDSTKAIIDDSILFKWNWEDYKGKKRTINFKLSKGDLKKARNNRNTFQIPGLEVWGHMFKNDVHYLKSIIKAYELSIKKNHLYGQEALDYVVSSIQYIGYTYICVGNEFSRCGLNDATKEDCRPKNAANFGIPGCCDNIKPWGVYSPFEFAYFRTGDCDTKSLFAYTILKGLGYKNVFVLHGNVEAGYHAMLGVKTPNPPSRGRYIRDYDGQKIYAWETTTGASTLGQKIWSSWTDWKIGLN
jgi:hypothetical protein